MCDCSCWNIHNQKPNLSLLLMYRKVSEEVRYTPFSTDTFSFHCAHALHDFGIDNFLRKAHSDQHLLVRCKVHLILVRRDFTNHYTP